MTNPTTHDNTKPSTVETIKEKATNLVHKVTGKTTDHQHDATHDHTPGQTHHDHTQHGAVQPDHTHDKINTSSFLSSTRLPSEEDPSAHATHPVTQPGSSHIPAHVHNVAPGTGLAGALHDEYPNPLQKDHRHHDHALGHHKVDDPQHDITSRLVGAPKDPNNLDAAHIKPVM
ncbi:hypothetical protein BGZ93_011462 [Podila epicladia]|nr:hypothetical protein BGZ92_000466 [Podila epicladia]KAG0086508.1 hypothetical protein BGZ93_011462 [Podila epicladia]